MAKKKEDLPPPIRRKCYCWIGIEECYCELDPHERQATRYSLQKDGEIHARFDTINQVLRDGRKRLDRPFQIYDHLEERIVMTYE